MIDRSVNSLLHTHSDSGFLTNYIQKWGASVLRFTKAMIE